MNSSKVHGDLTKEAYDALFATARAEKIRVVGHVSAKTYFSPSTSELSLVVGNSSLIR
jgi:hypothetical protein